jgi:hypothetical protein
LERLTEKEKGIELSPLYEIAFLHCHLEIILALDLSTFIANLQAFFV